MGTLPLRQDCLPKQAGSSDTHGEPGAWAESVLDTEGSSPAQGLLRAGAARWEDRLVSVPEKPCQWGLQKVYHMLCSHSFVFGAHVHFTEVRG